MEFALCQRWRKVRAPWKRGGGQRPPGVTPGTVQQKTNRQPADFGLWVARVKRCGKSSPRDRQRKRHGKPHREQDQIGMAGSGGNAGSKPASRPAIRVGRSRRPAMAAPDEWPSRSPRAPDRTRLTGRLVTIFSADKRPTSWDVGLFLDHLFCWRVRPQPGGDSALARLFQASPAACASFTIRSTDFG